MALSRKSHGHQLSRSVLFVLTLTASVATFLAITPEVFAQTDVPDVPTGVAVYSIRSTELEVRWSTSDAASTTSFKIQWKSGSEEFDSSRQLSSDPATSIVSEQMTSADKRYKETLTGLTDGAEYTVRVIAANSNGDSEPSAEATGTPQSSPGQAQAFIENEVIEIFESSHPWLRETWDYITTQNVPVTFSGSPIVGTRCTPHVAAEFGLKKCSTAFVRINRAHSHLIRSITHELAHVYTLTNGVTDTPGPLGGPHLYFYSLGFGGSFCATTELYADFLEVLVHGHTDRAAYLPLCSGTDSVIQEAWRSSGARQPGRCRVGCGPPYTVLSL